MLHSVKLEADAATGGSHPCACDKPIVADGLVASQKVIDGAEGAAEGVLVHMNNSIDAPGLPMQSFAKRYEQRYKSRPDLNSIKGFFAVQLIKAGVEVAGKVDQAAFLAAVRNTRFDAARFPELLGTVSYDYFGDLNRTSYFAVIRKSRPQIVASIRLTEGGMVEMAGGKLVTLDSDEFRRALGSAVAGKTSGRK